MFNVKDLEGHKFLVAFHLDNNEEVASMNIKVGRTMSISHAHQHQFVDGQVGIRLEDAFSVKVGVMMFCFLIAWVHSISVLQL